jgi:hypothetical protein
MLNWQPTQPSLIPTGKSYLIGGSVVMTADLPLPGRACTMPMQLKRSYTSTRLDVNVIET